MVAVLGAGRLIAGVIYLFIFFLIKQCMQWNTPYCVMRSIFKNNTHLLTVQEISNFAGSGIKKFTYFWNVIWTFSSMTSFLGMNILKYFFFVGTVITEGCFDASAGNICDIIRLCVSLYLSNNTLLDSDSNSFFLNLCFSSASINLAEQLTWLLFSTTRNIALILPRATWIASLILLNSVARYLITIALIVFIFLVASSHAAPAWRWQVIVWANYFERREKLSWYLLDMMFA